jgi:hypothetical protein
MKNDYSRIEEVVEAGFNFLGRHYEYSRYIKYRICKFCGKEFEVIGRHSASRFCSEECRSSSVPRKPISDKNYRYVFDRDDRTCQYCGWEAEQIDHVMPASKGGSSEPENLVAVCAACNYTVRDRVFSSFEEKKKWILNARKIHYKRDKNTDQQERPSWHANVYGGVKKR